MKTALRSIGNSKGAVIPAQLLKELGLKVGDQLDAKTEGGRLVMTPVSKPRYSLDELLAKCDKTAPMPKELTEWDGMGSVGAEL